MKKIVLTMTFLFYTWSFAAVLSAYALDPPHNGLNSISCSNCHMAHHAPGGTITKVEGNSNLCLSCHTPGGLASNKPFSDDDQAFPGQAGISHRFDSAPSGHVEATASNTSGGKVESGGQFTGRIEKIYTITITASGDVGTATFSWVDSNGNSGSGVTGTGVPLNDGLTLTFTDDPISTSFIVNDSWTLYVRTDLRLPDSSVSFERPMALRIANGKVVCSTCHDQHSQRKTPADPSAPSYGGPGTGWGRHYQRIDNNANQMCLVCHSARDVQLSDSGSHPVGIPIPGSGFFTSPSTLQLAQGLVECTTCHSPHYASSGGANGGQGDGYLLDLSLGTLCYDCHTIGDQSAASHLSASTGALWPGGQYGSTFPPLTSEKRGFCVNCHWPHGWPDDDNSSQDFPTLWVERYDIADDGTDPDDAEDLCFTCHDGSPASTDIQAEFAKGLNGVDIHHHPVMDSEQTPARSVECVDCHNPHQATSANKHKGVTGIDLDGNPVGPGTANDVDAFEYELCFKCHGDTYNASRPGTTNKRFDFQITNSAFHPVAGQGRNQSINLANQLLGGLTTASTIKCSDCHNNESTSDSFGPASNSSSGPKGPHGSIYPTILRDNYWTDLMGPSNWNQSNFALCFLCHDVDKLVTAEEWRDGASTNFYEGENLHWLHLVKRDDKARASCKNCHYNIHSNVSADNTQYRIDSVLYDTPPQGVHTHLVNFSPDLLPIGGRAKPEWRFDTSSRERRCYLSCHGNKMDGEKYRPDRDDDNPTVP